MTCKDCGTSTLGFIISVAGGTRGLSVAGLRSRSVYCKPCGQARVAAMNARDRSKARA